MNKFKFPFFLLSLLCVGLSAMAQSVSEDIRLNQIGFYPGGPKIAIVVNAKSDQFSISPVGKTEVVFSGTLKEMGVWEYSGEKAFKADFTKFNKEGAYILTVSGMGTSYPFDIKTNVHAAPAKASLRFFYYQRASIELTEEFAGKEFARKAGHPDNEVYVHASAASEKRPEGTVINSSKGWYDAGDYNKYIVNSGISTYTLINLYENFPKYFDTLSLNIPESKNNMPDLLDEIHWNLRWMITMQDDDGGIYHKLTNANFDGSIMPHEANNKRWLIMKSTAASLDFAAVMAQAGRVYKKFNKPFADSCLKAAVKAYAWAKKNPSVLFNQPLMNSKFNPDIQTGAYDDANVSDEFQWAAIELWISTNKTGYFEDAALEFNLRNSFGLPGWASVNTLGLYSILKARNNFPDQREIIEKVKEKIILMANQYRDYALTKSEFGVPMGQSGDFNWGSNSFAANQGMLLMQAYLLTNENAYMDAAIANLDYLMGRNGTNFSYLTGFGEKSTRNPHHRPSEADGIENPVPGMLAGGPNPGQEDLGNCGGKYDSKFPAKSYADDKCSYASNEIAINWNSPYSFLIYAIEASRGGKR